MIKSKEELNSQAAGSPLKITVIGISDREPCFPDEVKQQIAATHYFAGGNRHRQLVAAYLPPRQEWFPVVAPLGNLFRAIRRNKEPWIIFASGDPLFFGIANTLKRELPHAELAILPEMNSLQLLGHRLGLNYGEFKTISLTGRDWDEFDRALIRGDERLGILTDREKTPAATASRMTEYHYTNYRLYVGEHVGGDQERVRKLNLQEAVNLDFNHPNCFFLEKTDGRFPKKGIPDSAFEVLPGRPNMITKMPVRLATLASLQPEDKHVFWDIGACTGSISVEARLNYPHLSVLAFEAREESREIIARNARRFRAPGIKLFIGNYLDIPKEGLPAPGAVFLGGYGGDMEKILDDVDRRLPEGGTIAFNSVSGQSRYRFLNWSAARGYPVIFQQRLMVDEHNPIQIMTIIKPV